MYNINIFCSNNPYTYSFFAENEKKKYFELSKNRIFYKNQVFTKIFQSYAKLCIPS